MRLTPPRRASRRMAGFVMPCGLVTRIRFRPAHEGGEPHSAVLTARRCGCMPGSAAQMRLIGQRRQRRTAEQDGVRRGHVVRMNRQEHQHQCRPQRATAAHLDVVAQDLAVALGAALAQPLTALSPELTTECVSTHQHGRNRCTYAQRGYQAQSNCVPFNELSTDGHTRAQREAAGVPPGHGC